MGKKQQGGATNFAFSIFIVSALFLASQSRVCGRSIHVFFHLEEEGEEAWQEEEKNVIKPKMMKISSL